MPSTTKLHPNRSTATPENRPDPKGVALGASAYLLWGLAPAYFGLLAPAGPVEILAQRLTWTFVVMLVVATVTRRWLALRRLPGRGWAMVAAASVLISVNWGTYVYSVTSGHVVEAALGYFINPLISVLLGIVVLRERLRRGQWIALAVAGMAIAVLTVDYGRVPVIALVLALSFGTYGLLKKTVPLDSAGSLTAEGLILGPLAIGAVLWWQLTGQGTFTDHGVGHALLLVAAGPVTVVPLLLFGAATRRIPLAMVGLLQYLTPTLQFVWGVLVAREPMPASRWIGFALVWVALVVFTVDAVRAARRPRHPGAPARQPTAPIAGD
ncbi:putative RarD protein [Longimycelium tulufanense]|uniref:Putative RarD protein n=1 Tax=Longimycelium tulufanense TaxID=907463 RepID=A0A8J3CDR8_9PSEU|nr:EamA family transporter RarD [Longimycelium tulufanense]GGM52519.1 putative RarD protein [Longimycelium tulufanense]